MDVQDKTNILYNKGDYLKYYEKKGVPIAPTFLIKKNRDVESIIQKVKQNGWNSFVVKPDYAFANIEISKYDLKDTENSFESTINEDDIYIKLENILIIFLLLYL